MSIINERSIVKEKNGIKKIVNPYGSGYQRRGEIFYVNPKDRIVTCVLYGCRNDVVDIIDKYSTEFLAGYYPDCLIRNSYVGMAKCDPADEFDEEYGADLAKFRATRKKEGDAKVAMRKFTKKLRGYADLLDRKVESSQSESVNE